jgi:anti-sigma regulatory factor (Ser/Thr protein kinase)
LTKVDNAFSLKSLTIQNSIPEISRMGLWLADSLASYGLSKSIQFRIDFCANEAITNIISYAYPDNGFHEINIKLSLSTDIATLHIEDDGIAFNPLLAPENPQPKSLTDAKIGGLGIDLIKHYVDNFNYKRLNNKNMLSIEVNLN